MFKTEGWNSQHQKWLCLVWQQTWTLTTTCRGTCICCKSPKEKTQGQRERKLSRLSAKILKYQYLQWNKILSLTSYAILIYSFNHPLPQFICKIKTKVSTSEVGLWEWKQSSMDVHIMWPNFPNYLQPLMFFYSSTASLKLLFSKSNFVNSHWTCFFSFDFILG